MPKFFALRVTGWMFAHELIAPARGSVTVNGHRVAELNGTPDQPGFGLERISFE
jgi:hypothetical protein